MLLVPCIQEIVRQTSRCCFDMCRVGNLVNPETQQPIRKRLVVLTTSRALHQFLDGKFCDKDHMHHQIAGSIFTGKDRQPLSRYTENYPKKFARQVVREMLLEKRWERPLYAVEEEEHPTKRRRLGAKKSPSEIAQMFPSVNWSIALRLADSAAPRVGLKVIESGQIIDVIQALCPQHQIQHVVLCRGTDRYIGPSKAVHPGEAPLRRRVCIRRRFEDIQVDDEWEPWERLTQKGLRRKGTPARVSMNIFASVKPTIEEASTDAAIPRARPDGELPTAKRICVRESDEPEIPSDKSSDPPTMQEVIDMQDTQHGPLFLGLDKEERQWLLKMHRNMGHPGSAKLIEHCRHLGCPKHIMEAIPHLKCATCLETSRPHVPRPSAIHEPEDFGDTISMDGITWTNKEGKQFHFYHFVCHSTAFQTAVCSPSRTTEMAIRALMQGWISWAGPPGLLCLDAATELNSDEFSRFAQKHNICIRTIATDAHWQNARAERHGGILQEILCKMDNEETIGSYEQLEIALGFATSVKNQWSRHRGFPPEVLVFGKQRQIPASITSDLKVSAHMLADSTCAEGIRFRQELETRERARRAFAVVDNNQAMRRAIVQRTRPVRQTYEKGQWVMMWRQRGEQQGQWVGPSQVIIQEGPQVVWTTMSSKLYRIAPEHLRPVSTNELSQCASLRTARVEGQVGIGQGVTQFHDWLITAGQPSPQNEPNQTNPLNSPEDNQENIIDNRTNSEEEEPSQLNRETSQPDQEPSVESQDGGSDRPEGNGPVDPITIPVPSSDSEYSQELFVDEMDQCFHATHEQVWKIEIDITQRDIDNWKSESQPSCMAFVVSAAKKQRAEVKLSDLTEGDRKLFEQAKGKEIDSWISTETIARILRHRIPQENIMKCRWILTWKPIDDQEISQSKTHPRHKPKARLVVLGFQDPMVDSIPRDSPTLTKLSRMLILQMAASNRWTIGSFDVKTAFLRGKEQSDRILGVEPTPELRQKMQLQPNEVLQLLKGAYGRVDAPYLWFMELKRGLEDLGFQQAPFDPCAFVLEHNGVTQGLIGIHVDDGLCCGTPMFHEKLKALEEKFPFGSQKKLDFVFTGLHISQQADGTISVDQTQYVKDIEPIKLEKGRRSRPDDAVTETERQGLRALIGSLQYAAINSRPDLSHRLGLLQSAINRAKVEHILEGNKLLHEAKQHADVAIRIQPIPINDIRFVAFSDASFASEKNPDSYQGMVVMSAHKDIANNKTTRVNPIAWQSKKIQKVAVSTLSAEAMALGSTTDLLTWIRLYWAWIINPRIDWRDTDKTLLKLPPAFSALPEHAMEEHPCQPPKVHAKIFESQKEKDTITTDCKSLFDLVSKTAPPACQEFRTLLQAKLIREHLSSGIQIRWVPSGAQIADSLTKAMDTTMLRECLKIGAYSLHDEAETLRARSDARSRLLWLRQREQTEDPPSTTFEIGNNGVSESLKGKIS